MRCQPVRQRQQAGSQQRQNGNPGRLDLVGRNQRVALFLGLHLGKVGACANEAGSFGGIVRRTSLGLQGLIAQVTHIAAHRPDQLIMAALSLGDDPLTAQLLNAPFRQIKQPRNHADGLGGR